MLKKLITSVAVLSSFILIFSSAAFADSPSGTTNEVDNFHVTLEFEKNPISSGENNFKIELTDDKEVAVAGAQIKVTFDMDRTKMDVMGMDEPIIVTLTEGASGEYTGTVDLSKNGDWMAKTNIKIQSQDINTQFNFSVANTGPNWMVIGGFLGFMGVAVIVAFIIKKRKQ